jgi:hypothetical protein
MSFYNFIVGYMYDFIQVPCYVVKSRVQCSMHKEEMDVFRKVMKLNHCTFLFALMVLGTVGYIVLLLFNFKCQLSACFDEFTY